jgi:hypothetical protein
MRARDVRQTQYRAKRSGVRRNEKERAGTRQHTRRGGAKGAISATHGGLLLLLLGLLGVALGLDDVALGGRIAVGLGIGDLAGHGLGAATACGATAGLLLLALLVLLVGRLGDLDDDLAAVELLLVERVDGLLRGLAGGESDEAIACGTGAAHDDLHRDAGGRVRERGKVPAHAVQRLIERGGTYMSLSTGEKNAFSPSSVVEYARLPAKTC